MKIDHALVILAALIATLSFYAVLVIWTGDNPKFIEAAIIGLAGGLLGVSKSS